MKNRKIKNHHKAFTLIEIIAALSLSLVTMGILQSALSIGFKSQIHTQFTTAPITIANTILKNIQDDLQAVLPPTGIYTGVFTTQLDEEAQAEFETTSALSYYTTNTKTTANNKLAFVKQITLVLQPQNDDSETPRYSLIKTINTDFMNENPELEVKTQTIATNIHSLTYEFFNGEEWIEEWDSTDYDNSLPIAVKVTLAINKTPHQEETPILYYATKIIHMPTALTDLQLDTKMENN